MRPIRVLLVEDHVELRQALASSLSQHFELVGALDRGDAVLASALHLQPDAIVLDISLPGRSGLQVLPDLRAQVPRAAVVMITANDTSEYRQAALKLGAGAFLSKSTIGHTLIDAVRHSVNQAAR